MRTTPHSLFSVCLIRKFIFTHKANFIMQNKQTVMTNAVLANAAELAARTIEKLNTDAVSKSLEGSELTRQTVYDMSQVIFQQEIGKQLSGDFSASPVNV